MSAQRENMTMRHKIVLSSFILYLYLLSAPAALAQDECGPQLLPGLSETVTCDPADYPDGITYSSLGDLTLEVPDDPDDDLTVNAAGVEVTGNLVDSVFWDSSAFTSGDIVGTGGAVLDYSSGTGAIGIETGGDISVQGTATHAIRALSGSGDISVTTGGRVLGSGEFGIQAQSGGGDVTIETNGAIGTFGSAAQTGIRAETSGTGTVTVTVSDQIRVDSDDAVAAIDATSGSGLLTINLPDVGSSAQVHGASGAAIRTTAGGDAVIDVGAGRLVTGFISFASGLVDSDAVTMDLTAAGETTVNNAGAIRRPSVLSGGAIQAAGGAFTLNNDNVVQGAIDFSALTGGYTFNNNAGASWELGSVSNLGAGDVNNAGTIELTRNIQGQVLELSRGIVMAPGATFTGSGDSLLLTQVILDSTPQAGGCSVTATIAPCLNLTGGVTAGQTAIRVEAWETRDNKMNAEINPGIVLVDVNGGSSDPDHFVLDEGSTNYVPDARYGAVLDTGDGLFNYALLYDPGTQQHVLASVPRDEAMEYVSFLHQMLSIWHSTSDAVAGRQADLRDGAAGGAWLRISSEETERDVTSTLTIRNNRLDFDRSYSISTRTAIVGTDLVTHDDYVFGVHAGVVSSDLDSDDSPTRDDAGDVTFGAYGGWWRNGLSLDGTVNVNYLDLDHKVQGLQSSSSKVESFGVRLEAGWRLPLSGEALYIQPLATAAYVSADIEDLLLQQYTLRFEDTDSQRAALGFRLGGEAALSRGRLGRIGYWLTARAWEEYADEANLQYAVEDGDDLVIPDDLSGSFEEIGFGVTASDREDKLSVYFSGGAQFADETDSYNVSLGARLRW
jgi:hypothetical protein